MSRETLRGKVVIEEDYNDNLVPNKLDVIHSKIIVEEGYYEEEEEEERTKKKKEQVEEEVDEEDNDEDEDISNMPVDDKNEDTKLNGLDVQALDLSFISSSIPLKKRKISSSVCLEDRHKTNDYLKRNSYCFSKDNSINYNCFSSSIDVQLKRPAMIKKKSKSSVPLSLVKQEINKSLEINSSASGSIKGAHIYN